MFTTAAVPIKKGIHFEPRSTTNRVIARKIPGNFSLTVKDLQKSFVRYTEVPCFSVGRKLECDGKLREYALKTGDFNFSLNQDDGAKGWDQIKGLGLSFRFATDQNVDDIAKKIKSHCGTLDLEPTDMACGARIIRLTDLDGFTLSISQPLRK